MKRLFLLRHAKSGWAGPGQDDLDRPLSPRGRRSAPLMGRHMRDLGYAPTIALCSPARRTRDTWSCIRDILDCETAEEMPPGLYHPDPRTLVDCIRAIDDAHESAIVISHNPGLLAVAMGLMDTGVQPANPFGKYPAGALAVIDFDIPSWAAIRLGEGALVGFTRP